MPLEGSNGHNLVSVQFGFKAQFVSQGRGRRKLTPNKLTVMNTQMGIRLPNEKLDRNNFACWEYKMHQYLVGQGYWSYIEGAQESQPTPAHTDYLVREQETSRVLYYLESCVHDLGRRDGFV